LETAASLVTSFVIAVTVVVAVRHLAQNVAIITMSGFVGATWQAHYWKIDGEHITEHEARDGRRDQLARGVKWMDSDMVK
jgi:chaperone required for assembly of F1-ATPase